jgi:hypothetical protein
LNWAFLFDINKQDIKRLCIRLWGGQDEGFED